MTKHTKSHLRPAKTKRSRHVWSVFVWRSLDSQMTQSDFPFHWFKKGSCQLLAKECALSTNKLPRRLAQELTAPEMTWKVLKGHKTPIQPINNTIAKTLIRLGSGWSESSLGALVILYILSCVVSNGLMSSKQAWWFWFGGDAMKPSLLLVLVHLYIVEIQTFVLATGWRLYHRLFWVFLSPSADSLSYSTKWLKHCWQCQCR